MEFGVLGGKPLCSQYQFLSLDDSQDIKKNDLSSSALCANDFQHMLNCKQIGSLITSFFFHN